jgi:gas vesicle protein
MGKSILLLLGGAAIGAAVALLTAPTSGVETRRKLKKVSGDLADRASRVAPAIQHAYKKASAAGKEAFAQAWNDSATKIRTTGQHAH